MNPKWDIKNSRAEGAKKLGSFLYTSWGIKIARRRRAKKMKYHVFIYQMGYKKRAPKAREKKMGPFFGKFRYHMGYKKCD